MKQAGFIRSAFVLAFALFSMHANAQVDCGNGNYCREGNVCLLNGQCAPEIGAPQGSVRISTGQYCDPGYSEHRYKAGVCVPPGHSPCENGMICPPGTRCNQGSCDGGNSDGPQCGNRRCMAGRLCGSTGSCYNPSIIQDCGTGDYCTLAATCTAPRGCAYVSPERSPQLRR